MKYFPVAVLAILLLFTGCGMEETMEDFVRDAEIRTPDFTALEDGTYSGKYRSGVVMAKVRVAIDDGRITGIELRRHFNGQGEAAEAIVDDVVVKQKLEVDVIAGATYSSKVILKAIESALVTRGTPSP